MKRNYWLVGNREPFIFEVLDSISGRLSAKEFENEASVRLRALGYTVERQVLVKNRGDGMRGRVDLVAARPFVLAAIELDNVTPRKKSIFKVKQIKGATMRLVYCRKEVEEATI